MGCTNSKKSASASNSEKSFQAIDQGKEFKQVSDVVASHKDFVVQSDDMGLFQKKYEMLNQVIGKGSFGKVKKAILIANGEQRAVKIVDKLQLDETERVRMKYEIDILKNLDHPNIVKLYEIYETKSKIFLVTELCDGCELFDEITSRKSFSEHEAAHVTKQILQAILYCHNNNIAHRDLKPENVLIDVNNRGSIKVIDFGTSHHYGQTKFHTMKQMIGTPNYIAPEVLSGNYDQKCDLWSIGVMLYIMLSGQPPFHGSDDQIIEKVRRGSWTFKGQVWSSISEHAKDLVFQLMTLNVSDRPDAQQALAHPWIQSKNSQKFNQKLAQKAIGSLGAFQSESKLKQAAMTFLSSHLSTQKQQRELRQSFSQIDTNGDGIIQKDEFLAAYRKLFPDSEPLAVDERATEIFNAADYNGNGALDFGEWCTATINQNELLNEANLKAAFKLFDRDGGGTIEAAEVAAILGHNVSKEQTVWDGVIAEVDLNGDGQIDFQEFVSMMKKLADVKPQQE